MGKILYIYVKILKLIVKKITRYVNINQRKAGVFILISDKLESRARNQTKIKRHYIRSSVHQKDVKSLNMYVPINRSSKYIKQNLIKLN